MNYNVNDENFKNSTIYQKFLSENPKVGYLTIKASAAGGAVPIEGMSVKVSKVIEGNNVTFFEGATDNSGLIEKLKLPAPTLNPSDLTVPNSTTYDINTNYAPDNIKGIYKVNIYENLSVIQNINIVPRMVNEGYYGN